MEVPSARSLPEARPPVVAAGPWAPRWWRLTSFNPSKLRGYRWLELSTNPPANVAMPKLRAHALYGAGKNGLDGSRWLCLDGASEKVIEKMVALSPPSRRSRYYQCGRLRWLFPSTRNNRYG